MKLDGKADDGKDLKPGDVVWIKGRVDESSTNKGDEEIEKAWKNWVWEHGEG